MLGQASRQTSCRPSQGNRPPPTFAVLPQSKFAGEKSAARRSIEYLDMVRSLLEPLENLDSLYTLDGCEMICYPSAMASSAKLSVGEDRTERRTRGQGRGSSFFVLGHEVWANLWAIETSNRLNLVVAYLVLLAGTGADHRLTKWSAKACEEYTGLGKPRAKQAIEELVASGLIKRTDASTRLMPQYELSALSAEADAIFLPVQLVTGLAGEASMLRRVRETGDALALRMLIDLYGLISLDATHGVPIDRLHGGANQADEPTARKIAEAGAHAIWALTKGAYRSVRGEWTSLHYIKAKDPEVSWKPFWQRLDRLKQIGAIWFEPWAFDGEDLDAEPLLPLDASGYYGVADPSDEAMLTRLAFDVSRALVGDERSYVFDSNPATYYLPLTAHRRPPAYREVARLRVEADTPGRRLSWAKRRGAIEQYSRGFEQLLRDVQSGRFDRPMRIGSAGGGAK